jgi:hypothetical protein
MTHLLALAVVRQSSNIHLIYNYISDAFENCMFVDILYIYIEAVLKGWKKICRTYQIGRLFFINWTMKVELLTEL